MALSVLALGLGFGVSFEDEDCADKGKVGTRAKAASTIITKTRWLRVFGLAGPRKEKADSFRHGRNLRSLRSDRQLRIGLSMVKDVGASNVSCTVSSMIEVARRKKIAGSAVV